MILRSEVSVVAISQGPTPYYTPILNALSDHVRLHTIYMAKGDDPTARNSGWSDFSDRWGELPRFEHSFYGSLPIRVGRLDFLTRVSVGVSRELRRLNPDVVLVHSWGPVMIEPLLWTRRARRPAVMWTESGPRTGLLRDPISLFVRRRLVALADAFVSTGTPATRFIESLGADPRMVVRSCLPSLLAETIAATPTAANPGDASGTRFLFVGRLVELKRPIELAQAFLQALPSLPGATLTFVGDGPLRGPLAGIAAGTDGQIRVLERAEGPALVARYLDADVLVLPSVREVWGLVVNEALAAGLFVVATDQVASAFELLDKDSGLIVVADDPPKLVEALKAAGAVDQSASRRSARAARVAGCTPRSFAADLNRAIELALRTDAASQARRPST